MVNYFMEKTTTKIESCKYKKKKKTKEPDKAQKKNLKIGRKKINLGKDSFF